MFGIDRVCPAFRIIPAIEVFIRDGEVGSDIGIGGGEGESVRCAEDGVTKTKVLDHPTYNLQLIRSSLTSTFLHLIEVA